MWTDASDVLSGWDTRQRPRQNLDGEQDAPGVRLEEGRSRVPDSRDGAHRSILCMRPQVYLRYVRSNTFKSMSEFDHACAATSHVALFPAQVGVACSSGTALLMTARTAGRAGTDAHGAPPVRSQGPDTPANVSDGPSLRPENVRGVALIVGSSVLQVFFTHDLHFESKHYVQRFKDFLREVVQNRLCCSILCCFSRV